MGRKFDGLSFAKNPHQVTIQDARLTSRTSDSPEHISALARAPDRSAPTEESGGMSRRSEGCV